MKAPLNRHTFYSLLLLFFCLLEIACQTYWLKEGNRYLLSVIYFICGLGISVLPLLKARSTALAKSRYFWFTLLVFLLLSAFALYRAGIAFDHTRLDYRMADMLPVIQVMNERRLAGEVVYAPIAEIWNGLQPYYLPAMWMPYLPAVAGGLDLRWVNILFLLAGLAAALFIPFRDRQRSALSLSGLLPVAFLLWYIAMVYPGLITITEEPVVVGFYLLLGAALFRKDPLLLGSALAFCVLSRYALAFWIPMYLVYSYVFVSRRLVWRTVLVSVLVGVMLIWISTAWRHLDLFFGLQGKYLENLSNPAKNFSYTQTIQNNLGFAKFVPFSYLPMLHRTLLAGSLLLPWLGLGLFYRYRSFLNPAFFPVCSLKLSLVYFFNTIPLPYSYLFYTSTFLSIGIVYIFLTGSCQETEEAKIENGEA